MAWLSPEREVLAAAWRAKKLWLLQAAGNAVVLAGLYLWLWIPDAAAWQLLVSAGLALALGAAFLWLQGGTLLFFASGNSRAREQFWPVFRAIIPRLLPLALWLGFLGTSLSLVARFHGKGRPMADVASSGLTLLLQQPVSHEVFLWLYETLVAALFWVVLPLLLLPVGVQVARQGLAGFRTGWTSAEKALRCLNYWLDYLVLYAAGVYLPGVLVLWVPQVRGLWAETLSLVLRLGSAYLLVVTAWMLLAVLLGRQTTSVPVDH